MITPRARVLRAAERTSSPWKNGLGVTAEVAAFPPGSGFDDFGWRISMAQVIAGGPFSRFEGVDRTLAVLEGQLLLAVDGSSPLLLSATSEIAAFPGDIDTCAEVIETPVLDLNLMVRRGRFAGGLERLVLTQPLSERLWAGTVLYLARSLDVVASGDGWRAPLTFNDALLMQDADGAEVFLDGPPGAVVYRVQLNAV